VSFRALGGTGPVGGATIAFAGRTTATDPRGRAFLRLALPHPGRFTARATKRGFKGGSARVSARSRRAPIRFVG
jgi:hypothetical protein